jgi:hypothetical protein
MFLYSKFPIFNVLYIYWCQQYRFVTIISEHLSFEIKVNTVNCNNVYVVPRDLDQWGRLHVSAHKAIIRSM